MNKNYKILIVFFILFSLLFPTNLAKGATDIAYTFDDNVLIDSSISEFDSTFNVKNSSYYTEHYNATYSFENEIEGTSNDDIEFVDSYVSFIGGSILINNSVGNHNKVIELNDTLGGGGDDVGITNNFLDTQEFGSIESWIRSSEVSNSRTTIIIKNELGQISINLFIDQDSFRYIDAGTQLVGKSALPNIWYHVGIVFNCTSDTYEIWINNIQYQASAGFDNNADTLNSFTFTTRGIDLNYKSYIDAVGYSWEIEYRANYTFTFNELTSGNEFSATGIYDDWIYPSVANTDIFVRDSTPIDNEFLRFRDDSGAGFPSLRIPFIATTINAFSYYLRFSDVSQIYEWYIQDNANDRISMRVDSGNLRIWDGVIDTIVMAVSNNIWYNISVSFDCTTDSNQVFVDSDLKGTYDFLSNSITLNYLEFRVSLFDTGITMDFDSITNLDYVRLNYPIGLNLLPYVNSTNFREVNKFEYALKDINTNNVIGQSTYGSWSEVDSGGWDTVRIIANPNNANDRMVIIDTHHGGDTKGLVKSDFGINSNFVNITFGFDINLMAGSDSYNLMSIESSDFNTHSAFIIYHNGSLNAFSGTIAGQGQNLRNDIITGVYYEGNMLIDYQLERMILIWNADDIYKATYELPFVDIFGKEGLAEVRFTSHWDDNQASFNVDYCGVYANGISQSDEYGYTVYNIGQNWNTQVNNLLFLKANGTFDIGLVEGSYTVGMSMTTFRTLRNYFNVIHTINGFDSDSLINNATFVFTLQNHYFNISIFKIDGVLLKEGINEYNLEFEHSGVNIDESYFYVDTSNRLQFIHVADDSNLEYIQASFDINDVNSTDYAFSFRSDMDNNAYGYIRINYTDTSNLIQIPYILTTTRFLLSQDKTVHNILILITDKDNNVITGLTTGYIYNVELIDVISVSVSIITESLLNMIIPLIIILVPTLLFSQKFGKQVIIPLFILFSLILTISGMIPYWLFFIIIFPSIIMVFFKSRKEVA